jgi:hypothetical protein
LSQRNSSSSSQSPKRTYKCFVCEKNGFENIQVVLGGKDSNLRTIYLEPDGHTPHEHRTSKQSQQQSITAQAVWMVPKEDWEKVKADIAEIKQVLQTFQNFYGDLLEGMHKLTLAQQKNQQMADSEYAYDTAKEDGLV